jgi:two-component system sensor histidine kinase UhpB
MEALTGPTLALQEQFTKALETHLTQGGEAPLLSAYELGRTALNERLGVFDVATLLHAALVAACQRRPRESVRTVQAAAGFVLECLCSFEMAHRAVREANTALRGLNDLLEEQTRRISHELHDEAGQLLASVYLALDDIARDLPAPAAARLQSVKTVLDEIEVELRRLSHELRPTALDDLGLMPALDLLAEGVSVRTGLWVKIEGPRDDRFPSPIETVLYRIVQEALNNVGKHAQASAVTVVVRREARRVCCSVRDDGVGFDPGTAGRSTVKGVGLIGIRERLAPLGGALSIDAAPGRGTELRVAIPVL